MIKRVAIKEVKLVLRDRRLLALALILVVLQSMAAIFAWKQNERYEQERTQATRAIRKQWLEQDTKNPHAAAHLGVHVFPERTPLALVDSGLTRYLGVSIFLEAHRQNLARYRPAQDSTVPDRLGDLSTATILRVLFPLLLIVLAYSSVSSEKEDGTFRLSVALGINPSHFAIGKLIGLLSVVGLLLVPGAALSLIAILTSHDSFSWAVAVKLLALLLGYFFYLTAILCVSICFSALFPSRSALLYLSAFWLLNSIIVPIMARNSAQKQYPLPSVQEFQRRITEELSGGETGHNVSASKYEDLLKQTLAKYKVKDMEALPFNYLGYSMQVMENEDSTIYAKHVNSLRRQYDQQDAHAKRYGLIAPSLLIYDYSMALSGTDRHSHQLFADQAEGYRRNLVRTMNEFIAYESKGHQEATANRSLFERIPPFVPRPETAAEVFNRQKQTLVTLGLWAFISLITACIFSARMRVK